MKIAVYHNLPSGGARRALYEMAKGLAARGHVLDEFCPETADRTFLPLDGCVRRTVVLPFRPMGVWTGRVPMLTPYINAARLAKDLLTLARIEEQAAQAIHRESYDMVFSHDCRLALNPHVLRFLKTPATHFCHHGAGSRLPNPDENESVRGLIDWAKSAYYALPNRWYPWLRERRAAENIRRAKVVLANSYFAREGLYRAYGVEAEVVYLGVDSDRFRPLALHREPFLLTVGSIGYHKGFRFLVRALARLPAHRRPPLLIVANSAQPSERQAIETLARELEVHVSVRCITSDQELLSVYNRASMFVYSPIMEPFGLALLEAMACGTPAVAVREGGPRELVLDGETGVLVDRDEAALAESVAVLLADQGLRDALGRSGREHVRANLTWARSVGRLEHFFTRAVGGGLNL